MTDHLNITAPSIEVALSYHATTFLKTGKKAWLGKLPILKKLPPFKSNTQHLDLDLSCVVLSKAGQVLDTIWYGNLRSPEQSLRHTGDALCGATTFDDTLAPQEAILLKLSETDERACHWLFFINSNDQYPLKKSEKGTLHLHDHEKRTLSKLNLADIADGTHAMMVWHVWRDDDGFLCRTLKQTITLDTTTPQNFAQALSKYASDFITT